MNFDPFLFVNSYFFDFFLFIVLDKDGFWERRFWVLVVLKLSLGDDFEFSRSKFILFVDIDIFWVWVVRKVFLIFIWTQAILDDDGRDGLYTWLFLFWTYNNLVYSFEFVFRTLFYFRF